MLDAALEATRINNTDYIATLSGTYNEINTDSGIGYVGVYEGFASPVFSSESTSINTSQIPIIADITFVCGPFQRQMGHGFNGGFVHSHPVGFSLRRQKEAEPLIAARHLCLEGFSPCVGAAQEGVPGGAGFIPADENSVVVVCAFIEDPCPDAGFDDTTADPPLQQIGEHPAVVRSCRWEDELRPLFWLR